MCVHLYIYIFSNIYQKNLVYIWGEKIRIAKNVYNTFICVHIHWVAQCIFTSLSQGRTTIAALNFIDGISDFTIWFSIFLKSVIYVHLKREKVERKINKEREREDIFNVTIDFIPYLDEHIDRRMDILNLLIIRSILSFGNISV